MLSSIRLVVAPASSVPSSGCLSNEVKGWRLFMIADARARLSPTVGRGA
jgi:hypothetical protein